MAFLIMIPLFITSFKTIRRKMKPMLWKKLHRLAYVFYALVYIELVLLYAARLEKTYVKFSVYTIIFVGYGILKIYNTYKKKNMSTGTTISN